MKVEELRSQSDTELQQLLCDLEKEMYHLRNDRAAGDTKVQPGEMRRKRKTIARIHTILREKELQLSPKSE